MSRASIIAVKLSPVALATLNRAGSVLIQDKSGHALGSTQDAESAFFAQVLDISSRDVSSRSAQKQVQKQVPQAGVAKSANENTDKPDKGNQTGSKKAIPLSVLGITQQYPDKLKLLPGPFASAVHIEEPVASLPKADEGEKETTPARFVGASGEASSKSAGKESDALTKCATASPNPQREIMSSPIAAVTMPLAPAPKPQNTPAPDTSAVQRSAEPRQIDLVTAKASVSASAAASAANLAFAMRVNPATENIDQQPSQATHPDAPVTVRGNQQAQVVNAVGRVAEIVSASPQAQRHPEARDSAIPAGSAMAATGTLRDSAPVPKDSGVKAPATDLAPKIEAPQPDAVRNLRLQLQGENNQRVDVRLQDRGGELRVFVKSTDQNLSRALQDHMPELTARLDQQHLRTEVWVPRAAATPRELADLRSSIAGNGTTTGEDASKRRQNGQQGQQPAWIDEAEDHPRDRQNLRRTQI